MAKHRGVRWPDCHASSRSLPLHQPALVPASQPGHLRPPWLNCAELPGLHGEPGHSSVIWSKLATKSQACIIEINAILTSMHTWNSKSCQGWQHEWSCSMGDKFHCGSPQNPFCVQFGCLLQSLTPRIFPPAPLVLVMKHMHMHVMRRRFSSDISWKCLVSGSHERQLVFFALKKKQSPTQPLRLLRHQIYWGEGVSMPAVWNRRDKVDWTEPRVQMRETVRLWNKEGGIHDGNFSCRLYISVFQY